VTTPWLTGALNTGQPTFINGTAQTFFTPAHAWTLNDAEDGTATTAADSTGTLTATGTTGATWNTGELFTPDVDLNGTSGALSTTGPALNTNADFSVSLWAKADAAGGYALSQDGAHGAGFVLFPDSATKTWYFGLSQTDATSQTFDYAHNAEGPVQPGAWSHITATYNKTSAKMALYVDGIPSGTASHTQTWNATSKFQIGDVLSNNAHGHYFSGQLANVQVWQRTLSPTEAALLSGTPGYLLFPSDNTNYAAGLTWSTPCAKMALTDGKLSITETCTKTNTVSYGTTGYPTAVMVLQADGNLVIYKTPTSAHTAANSLWATQTYGHPGDALFLQPDGNLVIYDTDGSVLWASGTNN
jgi:hypothetical protein